MELNNQETNLVDNFLISKKEFIDKRTEEYIKAIIALELEKKEIDVSIKGIKKEARNDGVDVKNATKAFNKLKAHLKAKPEDTEEQERMYESFVNNPELVNEIYYLIKPIEV